MNKIERMLQELCPEGVEYKKLGEVCDFVNGFAFKSSLFREEGDRIIRITNIDGTNVNIDDVKYFWKTDYKNDLQSFIIKRGDILIAMSGATTGKIGYYNYDVDSYLNQRVGKFVPVKHKLDTRFLYHILRDKTEYLYVLAGGGAQPNLSSTKLMDTLEIPVPPLPIQEEIVRILDHFTELTAELQAELQARQEQYEYYRNELLTFTKIGGGTQSVTWMKISEIGEICMCKRIMKHQTNSNSGIPFYKIGTFGKKADAYISNELYEEYKKNYSFPRKGEILISASGTIGRTIIYDGEPAYFQDSNIIWISNDESKVFNKFLYYYFQIAEWKTEGGAIKRLYNANLAKMKIAVPPLSDQQHIINILDKFETLANDLFQGLPAEIAAVQEQYEYYRNKLLTFNSKMTN